MIAYERARELRAEGMSYRAICAVLEREGHVTKQGRARWQPAQVRRVCEGTIQRQRRLDLDAHLRRRFGISLAEFDAMLEAQGGVCAICEQPETIREHRMAEGAVRRLAVDHDHATGAVRGLLCMACNRGLGSFRDDPAILERARVYLG